MIMCTHRQLSLRERHHVALYNVRVHFFELTYATPTACGFGKAKTLTRRDHVIGTRVHFDFYRILNYKKINRSV